MLHPIVMYLLKSFLHLTELFSCAVGNCISVLVNSLFFPLRLELLSEGVCSDKGFGMGSLQAKWLFSQNHLMQVLLLQR